MDLSPEPREHLSDNRVIQSVGSLFEPPPDDIADGGLDAVMPKPLGHFEDRDCSFGSEGALGDAPTSMLGAEQVLTRYDYMIEEDLAEVGGTPSLLDGSYLDPRRAHVDGKATDALVLRLGRICANEQHAPVSLSSPTRPYLLSVDNVAVAAVTYGLGLKARKVRSRIGLGVTLTPHITVSDPWEESLALYGGGVMEQSRSNVKHSHVEQCVARRVTAGKLLGDHNLFLDGEAAAPLRWPVRRKQPGSSKFGAPGPQEVHEVVVARAAQLVTPFRGNVVSAPIADANTQFLEGSPRSQHQPSLRGPGSTGMTCCPTASMSIPCGPPPSPSFANQA